MREARTIALSQLHCDLLAAIAELESDLIVGRTKDGLSTARVRGCQGGGNSKGILAQQKTIKYFKYSLFVGRVCGMLMGMELEYAQSASRHGISNGDAYYAMTHPVEVEEIEGEPGDITRAFYGHPHPDTDRFIEVFAALKPWGTLVVFHAMDRPDITG